jgi:uncharacterized protein YdiU (UPF0061 family)
MVSEEKKEKQKLYYQKNKERIKERVKQYRKDNKDKIKNSKKQYRESNIDKIKQYANQYRNEKKKTNPVYKLKENIRNTIKKSIKKGGFKKLSRTEQILGCSYDDFKTHIESLWEPWMNWDNYGLYNGELNYGWDIDHKISLSNGKCEIDIIKLNHYTNLQPLCSKINRYIKKDNPTF